MARFQQYDNARVRLVLSIARQYYPTIHALDTVPDHVMQTADALLRVRGIEQRLRLLNGYLVTQIHALSSLLEDDQARADRLLARMSHILCIEETTSQITP